MMMQSQVEGSHPGMLRHYQNQTLQQQTTHPSSSFALWMRVPSSLQKVLPGHGAWTPSPGLLCQRTSSPCGPERKGQAGIDQVLP